MDATLKTSTDKNVDQGLLDISISGEYKDRKSKKKYMLGGIPNFASNDTLEDICEFGPPLAGGNYRIYTPQTELYDIEVVSSNANDTDGGSGVRTVKVVYLDSNWAEHTEIATLNGTTAVTVAQNIRRVNDMYSYTTGTNGVSAGTLTLQTTSGSTIEQPWTGQQTLRYIASGGNKDRTALYTVPLNRTVYVQTITNSSANQDQDVRLRSNTDPNSREFVQTNAYLFQSTVYIGSNRNNSTQLNWLQFPSKVDIKVSSISAGTNGRMSTHVTFIEVEDL